MTPLVRLIPVSKAHEGVVTCGVKFVINQWHHDSSSSSISWKIMFTPKTISRINALHVNYLSSELRTCIDIRLFILVLGILCVLSATRILRETIISPRIFGLTRLVLSFAQFVSTWATPEAISNSTRPRIIHSDGGGKRVTISRVITAAVSLPLKAMVNNGWIIHCHIVS